MPNRLSQFWQELKRRNVVRVITVYAGAAFVLLELVDMIREPFELPNWSFKLIVVILTIGLIIAVVLSWIYDIHPEGGMVKTKPADKVKAEDISKSSSGWKIASYISFVVIVGLIVLNIFGRNRGARIDESLEKSIAVLPFINMSGENEREFICDGLTDEIISHLFKVRSFDKVVSYSTVSIYKDSEKSTPEIAEELGVNYILEGSYKRMGEEIKITAQLIEPESDNHIWLQDYELPYDEIPGIPGEIALQIANNLKAFISEDIKQSIDRMPTDNIEAYEYLRQARNSRGTLTWDQRKELAEKAIELDPDYADAYAWIGQKILEQANFSGNGDIQSVFWEAERYINKAIEIDPYNISANWSLASINFFVKWDYVKVAEIGLKYESYFNSDSRFILGNVLFRIETGMFEKALSLVDEDSYWGIRTLLMSGDTSHARELFKRRDVLNEPSPDWSEFYIYFQEFDSVIYCFESMISDGLQSVLVPRFQAELGVAYYKTGHTEKARNIIGKIIQRSDTTASQSPAFFLGWYYGWIEEQDSAFYWLEKAVKNRSIEIPWLKVDPAFNSLKDDPRYWNLYERTGHKAFDDYMASRKE